MAATNSNLFGRYIWLVDTIRSHGKITYAEISRLWERSRLGYGEKLPWRTFMNHKKAIMEIFDINIECDAKDGYKYYIEDITQLNKDWLRSWLIDSYATLNQIHVDKSLENRIQFEEIPSGNRFLTRILEAMRNNKVICLTHQGFNKPTESTFDVQPYFIKVYNRRWYLIGLTPYYNQIRIYALDRIKNIEITDEFFEMPKDFNIEKMFEGCVGIIADKNIPIKKIIIKAYGNSQKYLTTLPLHKSQQKIESTEEYSIFEYHLRPNYEFIQLLLGQTDQIEVLEPKELQEELLNIAQNIMHYYK